MAKKGKEKERYADADSMKEIRRPMLTYGSSRIPSLEEEDLFGKDDFDRALKKSSQPKGGRRG